MNPWSPLTGLLSGALGAASMHALAPAMGGTAAAAVTAGLWTLLARDAQRASTAGAVLLGLVRWLALANLAAPAVFLVAVQTAPRSAGILMAYFTRPLDHRDGDRLSIWHAALALVLAVATAALCGLRYGWFLLSCCTVVGIVVRAWAESTAGGAGARHRLWLERMAECVILTTAACGRCRW